MKACVVKGYRLDARGETFSEFEEFDSLDGMLGWTKMFPERIRNIIYWRLYCQISLPNSLTGFYQYLDGEVTVQNTGTHLIITASTPGQLIERFNTEVQ